MNEFLLVLGMAVVTFAVRYPVMVLVSRVPLPRPLFNALKYVPPAVLSAIIVPAVLMPSGNIDVNPASNSFFIAAIVCVIVAWRTKNLLLTIVLGMATMLLTRVLAGSL
jgi:branched-subunit amino acid transport protein